MSNVNGRHRVWWQDLVGVNGMRFRAVVFISILTVVTTSSTAIAATIANSASDATAFMNVLKASIKAENAKDAKKN